jgi:Sigma-70 region 3
VPGVCHPSPAPNDAVLDVHLGDLDAATQVEEWLQDYATSRDPQLGERIILAYPVACVVGELKRYLRDTSWWRLHVPPPRKEQALRLARASDELHQRLNRSPATGELAEQLKVGEKEVLEAMTALTSRWEVSLDQPAGEEADRCLGDLVAGPAAREEPEDLLALPGQAAGAGARGHRPAVLPGPGSGRHRGPGRLLPDACLPPAAPSPGPHACPAAGVLTG